MHYFHFKMQVVHFKISYFAAPKHYLHSPKHAVEKLQKVKYVKVRTAAKTAEHLVRPVF